VFPGAFFISELPAGASPL